MEQQTKKILIVSGGIIALSLIGYKLFAKKSTTPNTSLLNQPTKTPIVSDNTQDKAPSIEDMPGDFSDSSTPSQSKYSSVELADMLQNSFNGYGTSWSKGKSGNVVEVLLSLNSDEDFDNLNKAYGVRVISSGFLNIFQSDFVGDMIGALNNELSKNEIAEANDILKLKGITRTIPILTTQTQE